MSHTFPMSVHMLLDSIFGVEAIFEAFITRIQYPRCNEKSEGHRHLNGVTGGLVSRPHLIFCQGVCRKKSSQEYQRYQRPRLHKW